MLAGIIINIETWVLAISCLSAIALSIRGKISPKLTIGFILLCAILSYTTTYKTLNRIPEQINDESPVGSDKIHTTLDSSKSAKNYNQISRQTK